MEKWSKWQKNCTRLNEFNCDTNSSLLIVFKNNSQLQNVAASERSRGLRQHAGLIEECVGVD